MGESEKKTYRSQPALSPRDRERLEDAIAKFGQERVAAEAGTTGPTVKRALRGEAIWSTTAAKLNAAARTLLKGTPEPAKAEAAKPVRAKPANGASADLNVKLTLSAATIVKLVVAASAASKTVDAYVCSVLEDLL